MRLTVNTHTFTLKQLYDRVLKKQLNMNTPSIDVVNFDNAIGTEEDNEDRPDYLQRPLADPGVKCGNGALLAVEDESQDFRVTIVVQHAELDEEKYPLGFELSGNVVAAPDLPADEEEGNENDDSKAVSASRSRKRSRDAEADGTAQSGAPAKKRKGEDASGNGAASKKKGGSAAAPVEVEEID